MPEPVDDMREAEIMAAIQQYKAKIDTQRPRVHPAASPHLATEETWDPELWATAMINSLQQPSAPVPPVQPSP
jgi:hypothetical protein